MSKSVTMHKGDPAVLGRRARASIAGIGTTFPRLGRSIKSHPMRLDACSTAPPLLITTQTKQATVTGPDHALWFAQ
jgi:hypothetical protein